MRWLDVRSIREMHDLLTQLGAPLRDEAGEWANPASRLRSWMAGERQPVAESMLGEVVHRPLHGDDVASWLKRERDAYKTIGSRPEGDRFYSYRAVDRLLDRYRECADCSLTLRPEDDEEGYP